MIVWVREKHVEAAKLPFPVFMVVGEKAWRKSASKSRKKLGAAAPTAVNVLQVSNPIDRCAQGLPYDALASKKTETSQPDSKQTWGTNGQAQPMHELQRKYCISGIRS